MLYTYFNDEGHVYKTDLREQERLNRDKCIPCMALKMYNYLSFKYLYLSGDDQALDNKTRHDHSSFSNMLHEFKFMYDTHICDIETGLIRKKSLTPMVHQRKEHVT